MYGARDEGIGNRHQICGIRAYVGDHDGVSGVRARRELSRYNGLANRYVRDRLGDAEIAESASHSLSISMRDYARAHGHGSAVSQSNAPRRRPIAPISAAVSSERISEALDAKPRIGQAGRLRRTQGAGGPGGVRSYDGRRNIVGRCERGDIYADSTSIVRCALAGNEQGFSG